MTDDWVTFLLSAHYVTGNGESLFLPKRACKKYLSDPEIQKSLSMVQDEIRSRSSKNKNFSFIKSTKNYVRSIFTFAGRFDNFYVQCIGGSCSIRVNRQDDFADPFDLYNRRFDGSKFLPEANKYKGIQFTPFQFGLTCEISCDN